jgi:hypothetical protein
MDTEAGIVMNTDEQTNFMDILEKTTSSDSIRFLKNPK